MARQNGNAAQTSNETAMAPHQEAPPPSVATVRGARGTFALVPETYREAREFAEMLAYSDMVPKDYRQKPGNVLAAIQMGAEVGLPPMAALQNIAVINGRPSLWGDGMLAVVVAHPECEDVREIIRSPQGQGEDAVFAECTVLRRGREPVTRTFSVGEAKRAGLWTKAGPWKEYPRRMLQMRARALALRDSFPDALRGLGSAEEQSDANIIDATTTPARPRGGNRDLAALTGPAPSRAPWTPAAEATQAKAAPQPESDADAIRRLLDAEHEQTIRDVLTPATEVNLDGLGKTEMVAHGPAWWIAQGWTPGDLADAIAKAKA